MTSVRCQHCDRMIGSPQGLVVHIKSMHPEVARAARDRVGMPPPAATPPPSPPGDDLVWEAPPETSRGRRGVATALAPKVEQLKARPGDWARIRSWASKSGAGSAAKTLRKAYPDIEFAPHATEEGSAIWARYPEDN